jgi:hypothetical protein
MAYWANRCGWDQDKGWYKHKYNCYECNKTIRQVWVGSDGNKYCLHCFSKKKGKELEDAMLATMKEDGINV